MIPSLYGGQLSTGSGRSFLLFISKQGETLLDLVFALGLLYLLGAGFSPKVSWQVETTIPGQFPKQFSFQCPLIA
jgi:hypothetical protein